MRALVSMAVAAALAFTLGAPRQADAVPSIGFGSGVRLPSGCTASGPNNSLECTGTGTKTFTVVITVGSEGMQGYSFGANWDDDSLNSLSGASGTQAFDGTLWVSRVPPVVSADFTPSGGARSAVSGIIDSTGTTGGFLTNWAAISSSPDSSLYTGAVLDGASYRAGRITLTVDNTDGTELTLGFFDPNSDSFLAAGGTEITPSFGGITFNGGPPPPVPEPGTTMLMGLGLLGLALASRSSRK